jgi:hypothetical protein
LFYSWINDLFQKTLFYNLFFKLQIFLRIRTLNRSHYVDNYNTQFVSNSSIITVENKNLVIMDNISPLGSIIIYYYVR